MIKWDAMKNPDGSYVMVGYDCGDENISFKSRIQTVDSQRDEKWWCRGSGSGVLTFEEVEKMVNFLPDISDRAAFFIISADVKNMLEKARPSDEIWMSIINSRCLVGKFLPNDTVLFMKNEDLERSFFKFDDISMMLESQLGTNFIMSMVREKE